MTALSGLEGAEAEGKLEACLTSAFGGGAPRAWPLFILALHPLSGLGWLLVILRMTLTLLNMFSL